MAFELSEKSYSCLYDIYELCKKELKIKDGSIINEIISKTNNTRSIILTNCSVDCAAIDPTIIKELEDSSFIYMLNPTQYTISFNGIWFIESKINIMNEEKLVDWIQSKYFAPLGLDSNKGVGDRNRCIAFILIAMRSFSFDSSMDLEKSDDRRKMWWTILKEASVFLHEMGMIKKVICDDDFIDKKTKKLKGSDDPIVNIARHSYSLKMPSGGRYNSNNLQYWFTIKDCDYDEMVSDLSQLIRLVFGNLRIEQAKAMGNFSNILCEEYGWKLEQYSSDTRYLDAQYDKVIKDAYVSACDEEYIL